MNILSPAEERLEVYFEPKLLRGFAEAIDYCYFQAYPQAKDYVRGYISSEFYPHNLWADAFVRVAKVERDYRERTVALDTDAVKYGAPVPPLTLNLRQVSQFKAGPDVLDSWAFDSFLDYCSSDKPVELEQADWVCSTRSKVRQDYERVYLHLKSMEVPTRLLDFIALAVGFDVMAFEANPEMTSFERPCLPFEFYPHYVSPKSMVTVLHDPETHLMEHHLQADTRLFIYPKVLPQLDVFWHELRTANPIVNMAFLELAEERFCQQRANTPVGGSPTYGYTFLQAARQPS